MEDASTLYSDEERGIGKEPKVDIVVDLVCVTTGEI